MSGHIYTQSEIFAVVRQLLKKYHAESAILFGSYARQEADAASDIDLIVVGAANLIRRIFSALQRNCIAPWEKLWMFTNCGRSMLVPLSIIRSWRKESESHEI